MSEPAPSSCSCRLPWLVTVIALGVLVAERFITAPTTSPSGQPAPVASPTPAPATTTTDQRIASLQQDLNDTRRVLDDAQSALAQRDREIATANDELRILRLELEALRATKGGTTPRP